MLPIELLSKLPPALAVLLRLIDAAFYLGVLLLLLRFLVRSHYMYGHGPWLAAIFNASEALCRPLRLFLPRGWFGVRDYTPLVGIALLLLIKPLLQAGLATWLVEQPQGTNLMLSWLALAGWMGSSSGITLARHVELAGIVLLFLAFCWQQAGRFWGYFFFSLLDEITLPYFRWTARTFHLRANLSVVLGAIFIFSVACGLVAAAAHVCGGLIFLLAHPQLSAQVAGNVAYLVPGSAKFFEYLVRHLLALFLFLPVMTLLQLLFGACIILVLMSWFQPNPEGMLFRMVVAVGGPPLMFAHRLAPWARIGILDFSPILLFFGLSFAMSVVQRIMILVEIGIVHAFS